MIFLFSALVCAGGTQRDGMFFKGGGTINDKQKWTIRKAEFKEMTGESTGAAPVDSPQICGLEKEFVTDFQNRMCFDVQEKSVLICPSTNPGFRFSGATPDFLQSSKFYPNFSNQRCECSGFYTYDPSKGLSDVAPDPPLDGGQEMNLDKLFPPDHDHNVTKNYNFIYETSYRNNNIFSFRKREISAVQERCVFNHLSSESRFRFSGATPDFLKPFGYLTDYSNRMCNCACVHTCKLYNTSGYTNGLSGVTSDSARSRKNFNNNPAICKSEKIFQIVFDKVMKSCTFAQRLYLQSDEQVLHPFRSETFGINSN